MSSLGAAHDRGVPPHDRHQLLRQLLHLPGQKQPVHMDYKLQTQYCESKYFGFGTLTRAISNYLRSGAFLDRIIQSEAGSHYNAVNC